MEGKKLRGRPKKESGIQSELPTESKSSSIMDEIENARFDFAENLSTPEVSSFNPLSDSVVERNYSSPNIAEGVVADLEEPTFHKESFQEIVQKNNPQPTMEGAGNSMPNGSGGQAFSPPPQQSAIPNPLSTQDFDDKERRESAEQLAEAMIDGYEMLNKLGERYFSISDSEFNEMVVKGEIDPARRLTIDEMGNQVTITDFKNNFNSQLGEVWIVENSFKKKVRPPLVRILMKHNLGMSDEVFLGVTVAKDVAVKSMSSYAMNKGVWNILNTLKDEIAQSKIEEDLRNMPPRQAQPEAPKPNQNYEKVEVEDVDEQMRRMTETNARAMGQMDDDFDDSEVVETGTNKFHINTHENPLREKRKKRDLSKNVKVKSSFQKGNTKI